MFGKTKLLCQAICDFGNDIKTGLLAISDSIDTHAEAMNNIATSVENAQDNIAQALEDSLPTGGE